MSHYEDFRWVTSRALDFALASLGARLPTGQAGRLVELYDQLQPFPDAVPALRALTGLGYELAVFSNGTNAMIGNCLASSGLDGFFGERISVDEVRVFKPSPVAYRHAAGRLSCPAGRVRLVTSNAFDCVGASAAGMRTAWVNRSAAPFDTIGLLLAGRHRGRPRPPAGGAGQLTPHRTAAPLRVVGMAAPGKGRLGVRCRRERCWITSRRGKRRWPLRPISLCVQPSEGTHWVR